MASYLACITSTGVPLFIRSHGDVPQLSFPVIGSLNGAHWFTSNAKASLTRCTSDDVKIVWRNYHECFTLILICSNDSPVDSHQSYLLDLIFNAIVLMVGLHDLLSVDNVESLKKDVKCCYPLIDTLLCDSSFVSPLTRGVEVVYSNDCRSLEKYLDSMTEQLQSGYGCVAVKGRVLIATDNWWHLHSQELILLSLFVSHLPPFQCVDVPVFLPKASSSMAHRLLVFQLVEGIHVMTLCDSEPSLSIAQEVVKSVWTPVKERVAGLLSLVPRCLPLTMTFDSSILSVCLVNTATHRTILSLFTAQDNHKNTASLLSKGYQGSLTSDQRRQYLVQFYKMVVDDLIPMDQGEGQGAVRTRVSHTISETYTNTEDFKAYAIHKDHYNLFVLFHRDTPTFALRRMSHDALDYLLECHVL